MGEIHDLCVKSVEDVREDRISMDKAEQVHKLSHRAVHDRYVDLHNMRLAGSVGLAQKLKQM